MTTTIENVTDRQINQLAAEAAQAGDEDMYWLAVAANNGDDEARAECVASINAAEAQSEEPSDRVCRELSNERLESMSLQALEDMAVDLFEQYEETGSERTLEYARRIETRAAFK